MSKCARAPRCTMLSKRIHGFDEKHETNTAFVNTTSFCNQNNIHTMLHEHNHIATSTFGCVALWLSISSCFFFHSLYPPGVCVFFFPSSIAPLFLASFANPSIVITNYKPSFTTYFLTRLVFFSASVKSLDLAHCTGNCCENLLSNQSNHTETKIQMHGNNVRRSIGFIFIFFQSKGIDFFFIYSHRISKRFSRDAFIFNTQDVSWLPIEQFHHFYDRILSNVDNLFILQFIYVEILSNKHHLYWWIAAGEGGR